MIKSSEYVTNGPSRVSNQLRHNRVCVVVRARISALPTFVQADAKNLTRFLPFTRTSTSEYESFVGTTHACKHLPNAPNNKRQCARPQATSTSLLVVVSCCNMDELQAENSGAFSGSNPSRSNCE